MKPPRTMLRLMALATTGAVLAIAAEPAAKAPKPSVPNPFAGRFKQVQERIDALFSHRNQTPPPPDPRANPFRMPGAVPSAPVPPTLVAPGTVPVAGAAPGKPGPVGDSSADLPLLQQGVATLKVNGVFEIAGRSHLVINARPYKEGDILQVQVRGEPVYLRVQEISWRSVTFKLNDAEMTLRY